MVGVDPYVRADRSEAVFDADLMAMAVIPLQVVVRNLGEHAVPIQVRNFRLGAAGPGGGGAAAGRRGGGADRAGQRRRERRLDRDRDPGRARRRDR